jgi:branched-chain amino acid aminotransferase
MELYAADALFACGSGAGIVPIAAVDGVEIATVGNAVAAAAGDAYREATRDPRFLLPVA